jgi:hypothetical protein
MICCIDILNMRYVDLGTDRRRRVVSVALCWVSPYILEGNRVSEFEALLRRTFSPVEWLCVSRSVSGCENHVAEYVVIVLFSQRMSIIALDRRWGLVVESISGSTVSKTLGPFSSEGGYQLVSRCRTLASAVPCIGSWVRSQPVCEVGISPVVEPDEECDEGYSVLPQRRSRGCLQDCLVSMRLITGGVFEYSCTECFSGGEVLNFGTFVDAQRHTSVHRAPKDAFSYCWSGSESWRRSVCCVCAEALYDELKKSELVSQEKVSR